MKNSLTSSFKSYLLKYVKIKSSGFKIWFPRYNIPHLLIVAGEAYDNPLVSKIIRILVTNSDGFT